MTRARVLWLELEFAETDVRDVRRTKCSAVPASVCHHHEDQNNAIDRETTIAHRTEARTSMILTSHGQAHLIDWQLLLDYFETANNGST